MQRYATRFLGNGDEPWDIELRNSIIGEILDIGAELKSRGDLGTLLPLLDHPNNMVRTDAAIACRSVAPERAVPVLEAIAAKPSQDIFRDAWEALYGWRSGELK